MKTLKDLAEDAANTIESGYYRNLPSARPIENRSLIGSIKNKSGHAIICEIKFASPSAGRIDDRYDQVSKIAKEMEAGGAAGLSVLTEPKNFGGSLSNLVLAGESTKLPVIMKDVVVSKEQIIAARELGASAVLFIWEIFSEGYSAHSLTLQDAIRTAKDQNLEVILETHSREGLREAAKLDYDIVGINNRDLKTFKTSINTTIDLLGEIDPQARFTLQDRLIMSESGYETASDISYVRDKLKSCGSLVPDAYLIGTSIMKSTDVWGKVMRFAKEVAN